MLKMTILTSVWSAQVPKRWSKYTTDKSNFTIFPAACLDQVRAFYILSVGWLKSGRGPLDQILLFILFILRER